MTEQVVICINCPVGCRMVVKLSSDGVFESVSGNACERGAAYAEQECTLPLRTITAVISIEGSKMPLSVKTTNPIPKTMIKSAMKELAGMTVRAPIRMGQVIMKNIMGTGADVVATRSIGY